MKVDIVQFDAEHSPNIVDMRTQVFVKEQGVARELDFDGLDDTATHALLILNGITVATGRILGDGHIGRIAVLKNARGQGAGAIILKTLVNEASKQGYKRVYLGSQIHAIGFYEKLGFNTCGEVFIDAGMEHIEMELFLG
jgi:predicted GNAT family N-acyltransferase